jgi:hypothetical protein
MCERRENWLTACTLPGGMARFVRWAVPLGILALIVGMLWVDRVGVPPGVDSAVGTAGHGSAPEPDDSPATLHDLETLTGTVDPHELIGTRVDFHVRVRDVNDDMSFWIGNQDNRILVVHNGVVPNGSAPLDAGRTARVIGSIEMRGAEPYIRADRVMPEG